MPEIGKQFAGAEPKFFENQNFAGMNNRDKREAIEDEQFAWLENMQPIAKGNLRALYSNGAAIYTTAKTIIYMYFYNFALNQYVAVFFSDGTAVQVNTNTLAVTTITSTAGAFYPGVSTLGTPMPACAQYGQSNIVIVSTGTIPYAIWDGTALYYPGTLALGVILTTGGAGYQSVPTVTVTGGSGSGASLVASIGSGQVQSVTIINPGSGYKATDPAPTVTFSGGTSAGSGASESAVLSHSSGGTGAALVPNFALVSGGGSSTYQLTSVTITTGGTGYSSIAQAAFGAPPGSSQWASGGVPGLSLTVSSGVIAAVTINAAGSNPGNYYFDFSGFPTISVSDTGYYFVSGVTVTSGGSGYSASTVVTVTGGGSPQTQAVITPVIAAGVITTNTIVNPGVYGTNTPPTLTVSDTSTPAAATVSLMPFGIQGTCVETYNSRVWVGYAAQFDFTAPGNESNFNGSVGGGSTPSNDSFLRREFTQLKNSNGFLYLFADSSINSISNVQSTGSPIVTTMNNQNIDPSKGSPWHNSVQAFSDKLIFANSIGVFTLSGGNVEKISDEVDGVFQAAATQFTNATSITQPSAAVVTINEVLCYCLLVWVKGPFDNSQRRAMVCWDGKKWFVASQVSNLTFIATQQYNSVINAWGTDGTNIFQLFTTATTSLKKTWQSKLWSKPTEITKQALRSYWMGNDNSGSGYSWTGTIDYVLENTATSTQPFSINGRTASGPSVNGQGLGAFTVRGNYLGLTLHSQSSDFSVVRQSLLYREESPLGA